MTTYSNPNPQSYVTSNSDHAHLSRLGFKPITIGGKRYHEFEYAGIVTHCRPLPFKMGLQVFIVGLDGQALEIRQSNHDEMVKELKSALETIAPWSTGIIPAHIGGGVYRSQCQHCKKRYEGEYTPTSNFSNTHNKWGECQR